MHKKPHIIIGGVVLSSIGAFGAFAIYRTTSAADHDAAAVVASGTIEATQAELGFQASGRLETITVVAVRRAIDQRRRGLAGES